MMDRMPDRPLREIEAGADLADRRRRSQEITLEVERLVGLRKRTQALVTPNARLRGLTA